MRAANHHRSGWPISSPALFPHELLAAEVTVASPGRDLPDIIFRHASFELKEVLDPDRRRRDEYKRALSKTLAANDPIELFKTAGIEDITPIEIVTLILSQLDRLSPISGRSVREAQKGLVTSDKAHAPFTRESNDVKSSNSAFNIRRLVNRLVVPIALVLSWIHVELACLQNRDSGKADQKRAEPLASPDAR